ncbi:MAG TPA: SUMF1/EgtB/PvdO family nonheme iron enzyme, partial [Nitrospiraceae bacterium]|nr:SUMF1/EgtB/PvdO family nonheme iron enzyme [Nitrospiraceae bacterium]
MNDSAESLRPGASAFAAILTIAMLTSSALPSDAQLDRLRKSQRGTEAVKFGPSPMALIPAGEFWMGRDGAEALEDERPLHKVRLDAYFMDIYEVATARYAEFLSSTNRPLPLFWDQVDLSVHGDRPVIGVNWDDADAYCRWQGKRLPT